MTDVRRPSARSLPVAGSLVSRSKDERLAGLYDDEVYPLWGRTLDGLLLGNEKPRSGSHTLFVGCGTGHAVSEWLQRGPYGYAESHGRVVALEASAALLQAARVRLAQTYPNGKVFWKAYEPEAKLPFAASSFDRVFAQVDPGLWQMPTEKHQPGVDPGGAVDGMGDHAFLLADLARMAKPDASLSAAMLLRDSWREFLDVFRATLVALGKTDAVHALAAHEARQPDVESLLATAQAAGWTQVTVERRRWELLFRSAREFLYAPVVEYGPLPLWKSLAGRGSDMQEVFVAVKNAIATYFGGRTFAVTLEGAVVRGHKAEPAKNAVEAV